MVGSEFTGVWNPGSCATAVVGHPTATTAANTAPPMYRWRMTRFPLQRRRRPAGPGSPTRSGPAPRFDRDAVPLIRHYFALLGGKSRDDNDRPEPVKRDSPTK